MRSSSGEGCLIDLPSFCSSEDSATDYYPFSEDETEFITRDVPTRLSGIRRDSAHMTRSVAESIGQVSDISSSLINYNVNGREKVSNEVRMTPSKKPTHNVKRNNVFRSNSSKLSDENIIDNERAAEVTVHERHSESNEANDAEVMKQKTPDHYASCSVVEVIVPTSSDESDADELHNSEKKYHLAESIYETMKAEFKKRCIQDDTYSETGQKVLLRRGIVAPSVPEGDHFLASGVSEGAVATDASENVYQRSTPDNLEYLEQQNTNKKKTTNNSPHRFSIKPKFSNYKKKSKESISPRTLNDPEIISDNLGTEVRERELRKPIIKSKLDVMRLKPIKKSFTSKTNVYSEYEYSLNVENDQAESDQKVSIKNPPILLGDYISPPIPTSKRPQPPKRSSAINSDASYFDSSGVEASRSKMRTGFSSPRSEDIESITYSSGSKGDILSRPGSSLSSLPTLNIHTLRKSQLCLGQDIGRMSPAPSEVSKTESAMSPSCHASELALSLNLLPSETALAFSSQSTNLAKVSSQASSSKVSKNDLECGGENVSSSDRKEREDANQVATRKLEHPSDEAKEQNNDYSSNNEYSNRESTREKAWYELSDEEEGILPGEIRVWGNDPIGGQPWSSERDHWSENQLDLAI